MNKQLRLDKSWFSKAGLSSAAGKEEAGSAKESARTWGSCRKRFVFLCLVPISAAPAQLIWSARAE